MTLALPPGGSGIRTSQIGEQYSPGFYKPSFSVFYSERPIVCPRYAVLCKTKNVFTCYFRANLAHKKTKFAPNVLLVNVLTSRRDSENKPARRFALRAGLSVVYGTDLLQRRFISVRASGSSAGRRRRCGRRTHAEWENARCPDRNRRLHWSGSAVKPQPAARAHWGSNSWPGRRAACEDKDKHRRLAP